MRFGLFKEPITRREKVLWLILLLAVCLGAALPDWTQSTVTVGVGNDATIQATTPTAAASTAAGKSLTLKAGSATAGTTNNGAAAGGYVYLTAGTAARLNTGDADGGDVVATGGNGIGDGDGGNVVLTGGLLSGAGANGYVDCKVSGGASGSAIIKAIGTQLTALNATNITSGALGLAYLTDGATAGVPLVAGGVGDPSYTALDLAQATAVSGLLAMSNGGTGTNLTGTQYGLPYFATATTLGTTAAGTATTLLHGNATGIPTWSAVSLTADVSGILPVLNGGTGSSSGPVNVAITDDTTTNATMYPTWVTTNTGNLPVYVSSSKMTFNPSTGNLGANIVSTQTANTASVNLKSTSSLVTLSTASTTTTMVSFIPADAFIVGVVARVTEVIDTAAQVDIGVAGDTARFVDDMATAATSTGSSYKLTTPLSPYMNAAAVDMVITVNAQNTATGIVRVTLFYFDLTEPGS